MKPFWVGTSWKMNKNAQEAKEWIENIAAYLQNQDCKSQVFVIPPFPYIEQVSKVAQPAGVLVGGQNMCWEDAGAFTGEISPLMLKDCGADIVEIGHSERRHLFGETDEVVAEKVKATLNAGLIPIVCVGETEQERENEETMAVITRQVKAVMDILPSFSDSLVFAYEPVWAIGTGKTATCEQAEEVHKNIRQILISYNHELGNSTRILYGGSVKPENSKELFSSENIDGGLIGGASLKVDDFLHICNSALA